MKRNRNKGSWLAAAAVLTAVATAGCGGTVRSAAPPAGDPAAHVTIDASAPAKAAAPAAGPWLAVSSTSGFAYRLRAVGHPRAITHYENSVRETVVAPPGKEFITFTGEIANAMTDRPVVTNSLEGSFDLVFPSSAAAAFGAVPQGTFEIEPGPGNCPPDQKTLPAGLCDLDLYLLRLEPERDAVPVGGSETQTWVVSDAVPTSAPVADLRLFFTTSAFTEIPWAS